MERAMGGSHWYSFNYGGGWKKYDRFKEVSNKQNHEACASRT